MVMKIRRLLAGVLLAAGILACGMVSPADEAPSLEQVYVNMPEVMAYGQGSKPGHACSQSLACFFPAKTNLGLQSSFPK